MTNDNKIQRNGKIQGVSAETLGKPELSPAVQGRLKNRVRGAQLYQHASFFAFFFIFPVGVIFLAFPKPGVIFCIFLTFPDHVCNLHRLSDPNEKRTRRNNVRK